MNISFAQYISEIDFLSYFDKEILPKKGGGRDHMSPSSYRKTFINEIEWLKEKCISGDYKFSPYQEKLILKGKNKLLEYFQFQSLGTDLYCLYLAVI